MKNIVGGMHEKNNLFIVNFCLSSLSVFADSISGGVNLYRKISKTIRSVISGKKNRPFKKHLVFLDQAT